MSSEHTVEMLLIAVDDDERRLRREKLLDDVLPCRAAAGDDDVSLEAQDRLSHSISPERLSDRPLDEERGEVGLEVREHADAARDDEDGQDARPANLVQARQLAEADGRDRRSTVMYRQSPNVHRPCPSHQ